MKKSKSTPIFALAGFLILGTLAYLSDDLDTSGKKGFHPDPYLSQAAKERMLYGDSTGGGHKHGAGVACKSEFPESWGDGRIFDEVELIANNDNLPWRHEGNGYNVVEDIRDGVKVRVVVNNENGYIVSAYPLNKSRNPCPANDR